MQARPRRLPRPSSTAPLPSLLSPLPFCFLAELHHGVALTVDLEQKPIARASMRGAAVIDIEARWVRITMQLPDYFDVLSAGFVGFVMPWRIVCAPHVIARAPHGLRTIACHSSDLLVLGRRLAARERPESVMQLYVFARPLSRCRWRMPLPAGTSGRNSAGRYRPAGRSRTGSWKKRAVPVPQAGAVALLVAARAKRSRSARIRVRPREVPVFPVHLAIAGAIPCRHRYAGAPA